MDGNSRFAKHNVYKSDVFSVGLLFFQLAAMEDVTGFNQKSQEYDGEKLIVAGINRLKQRFPDGQLFTDTIRQMLKFHETERPSFCELLKFMQTNSKRDLTAQPKTNSDKKQPAGQDLHVQTRHSGPLQNAPQQPAQQEVRENQSP